MDRNTVDPIPGLAYYARDENGEPSGWVTESAATVFGHHFQKISKQTEQSMLEFLHYLRDLGVTTLLDGGNFGLDEEIYDVISRWDREPRVPGRIPRLNE